MLCHVRVIDRLNRIDNWAADPGPRGKRIGVAVILLLAIAFFAVVATQIPPVLLVFPAAGAAVTLGMAFLGSRKSQ